MSQYRGMRWSQPRPVFLDQEAKQHKNSLLCHVCSPNSTKLLFIFTSLAKRVQDNKPPRRENVAVFPTFRDIRIA